MDDLSDFELHEKWLDRSQDHRSCDYMLAMHLDSEMASESARDMTSLSAFIQMPRVRDAWRQWVLVSAKLSRLVPSSDGVYRWFGARMPLVSPAIVLCLAEIHARGNLPVLAWGSEGLTVFAVDPDECREAQFDRARAIQLGYARV